MQAPAAIAPIAEANIQLQAIADTDNKTVSPAIGGTFIHALRLTFLPLPHYS
jgi:hypothetical protein